MSTQVFKSPARKLMIMLIIAMLLLAGSPSTAYAGTQSVTNGNDSGAGSLRAAVTAAAAGDTIEIAASVGTIALTTTPISILKNITITTLGGGSTTITAAAGSRIFTVSTAAGLNISNLTLTGGSATLDGGAISVSGAGSSLTANDVTFSGNATTTNGGAIYVGSGTTLTATNVTFSNNTAVDGGAIYSNGGTLIFTDCTFSTNTASNATTAGGGGAIYASAGSLHISSSSFAGNSTTGITGSGGAIHTKVGATISDSTFSNNLATANTTSGKGGAIYNNSATGMTVTNSTFTGNQSGIYGGAIDDAASSSITGSTFSSNSTLGLGADRGGALRLNAGGTIKNSTFSGNTAAGTGLGGGLYAGTAGTTTINNSTFSGNSSGGGSGGAFYATGASVIVVISNDILANSVSSGNCAAFGSSTLTDAGTNLQFGGTVNKSCGAALTQPATDPLLGASLADNGGPTETIALPAGSAAIDAGGTGATACETTDQRGMARPQGTACDIGAFEVDKTAPVTSIGSKPALYTTSTNADFTFSATDNFTPVASLTYECSTDDITYTSCTSPQSFSGLADGVHAFYVRAYDAAGNIGPTSYTWTVDTIAPTTTIGSKPANPSNDNTPSFSFTGSDTGGSGVAIYECKLDTGAFTACTSTLDYAAQSDGPHTFEVRAIDLAGNVDATPDSYAWIVDTTAPVVSIDTKPANPSSDNTPAFAFSATDTNSVAGYDCSLDSASFTTCASPLDYATQPDGLHTFEVHAIDTAGNVGSASYNWRVDTTAPDTAIGSKPANPSNDSTPSFSFTGSDTGGSGVASYECKLDIGAFTACTSALDYAAQSDGPHTFEVRAIDLAGNVDASPDSYAWVIDTVAPVPSIDTKPTDPSSDNTPAFTFSATDAGGSGPATYQCKLDTEAFATCSSPLDYTTPLLDGPHTFSLQATDYAGNTSAPISYTWTIDTTTLTPTLTSPTADGSWPNTVTVTYTLQETPLAGSVTLTFASDTTTYTNTLHLADSAAAQQVTFTLDPLNVLVAPVISADAATIPTDAYTITLSYQDALGNPATTSAAANVAVGHFTISGDAAGMEGVLLTYDGGTTTSVAGGAYSFTVPYHWNGTLTPSKLGYTFTPTDISFTLVGDDFTAQDFTAELRNYTVSGNVGTDGATLKFGDGTIADTSDVNGDYSFLVPHGWSGTVKPSKDATYIFSPAIRTYTNVQADISGEVYTVTRLVTFKSAGIYDGWVLESLRTSNKGGFSNSAYTTFQLGDDALNRQYKAILSFDTTSLPANAIILSAKVRIKQSGLPVGDKKPFTTFKGLQIDIGKPLFGTIKLVPSDWEAPAKVKKVGTFGPTPAAGWYTANLTLAGRNGVSKGGVTQLRLYFTLGDNGNNKADYIKFFSGNSKTGQPELIITYKLP